MATARKGSSGKAKGARKVRPLRRRLVFPLPVDRNPFAPNEGMEFETDNPFLLLDDKKVDKMTFRDFFEFAKKHGYEASVSLDERPEGFDPEAMQSDTFKPVGKASKGARWIPSGKGVVVKIW